MKVSDLVRLNTKDPNPYVGGIVLDICDDLGIVTIDVLMHNGTILYDERIESWKVVDESG